MSFEIEMKAFDSEEQMLEYMNSAEVMKPLNDYIEQVHARCLVGLNEADRRDYLAWHQGEYKPSREEQERNYKERPDLAGAIMESISWGLG